MMTLEMVMELLEGLGDDMSVSSKKDKDGEICVYATVEDFEGFDEDWHEVDRKLDDEEAVVAVYDRLKKEALSVAGDYYRYFQFEGFYVEWGNASMEI